MVVLVQNFFLKRFHAGNGPAIQFNHFFNRDGIFLDVEVAGVGKQEADRVSEAAISVNSSLKDLFAQRNFSGVVRRGNPQTKNFGTVLVVDFRRSNDVAERLTHLAALFVNGEAVGQKSFVRSTAVDGTAREQRRMEPSAVLVAAFKIQVSRISQLIGVRTPHHGHVGCTGVKPHVERVFGLLVHFRFKIRKFGRCQTSPGFDAFFFNDVGNLVKDLHRFRMQFAGFLMDEEGQRNAPVSLTGNTPVRTVGDHVVQTDFAPLGNELGCFNCF